MFCTNCGTKVVEGSAHCTGCGTRVDGQGLGTVAYAARSAYLKMDETLKRSIYMGGGAVLTSLMSILLIKIAPILLIIVIPASVTFGIMALNAGRELDNRTGYYLGMIGLTASVTMLYTSLIGLTVASIARSAASSAMEGLF